MTASAQGRTGCFHSETCSLSVKVSTFKRIVGSRDEHFPSLVTMVDLCGVNFAKLEGTQEQHSFDTSGGQGSIPAAACHSLCTSSLASSSPHWHGEEATPSATPDPARSPSSTTSTHGLGVFQTCDKGHQFLLQNTHHQHYRHRWWETKVGSRPSSRVLDHLCRFQFVLTSPTSWPSFQTDCLTGFRI